MKPTKIAIPTVGSAYGTIIQRLLKTGVLAVLLLTLSVGLSGAWWNFGDDSPKPRQSALPTGNAISDPNSLLMYALPIENDAVRRLQESLEDIALQLRSKRWNPINSDLKTAKRLLEYNRDDILASIPADRQPQAEKLIEEIEINVNQLQEIVPEKDKENIWLGRREALNKVAQIEELMVTEFPFEVPEEYADLPQLKGRAKIAMETTQGDLTIVVDGYNAPVTAGNFVDLVQRGFYDGLDFIRAEQSYVLQAGDPPGEAEGFIDPETGEYRAIPLEIKMPDEDEPFYGVTLEDVGIYLEQPALPFSAYGTLAMARPGNDPNGGSSQFFFLLLENDLTPPGFNLLDGRYSVFGYVVEGEEVLGKIKEGDSIISAEVVDGAENLEA
jgi:peptidylprolyl isomerase